MRKSLFDRALNVKGGVLESRLIARSEDKGRPLTDDEVLEEMVYLKETFPYSGHTEDTISAIMEAVNYILRKYGN